MSSAPVAMLHMNWPCCTHTPKRQASTTLNEACNLELMPPGGPALLRRTVAGLDEVVRLGAGPSLRLPYRGALTGAQSKQESWYKTVTVSPAEEGFQVLLDGRKLRTPARHALVLPNKALAIAVAAEWQWQDSRKIRPFTMPFMSLAATAIDQPKDRGLVVDTLLTYIHADAACCREDVGPLAARQAEIYDPIVAWACKAFMADFVVSNSIFGTRQPENAVDCVRKHLEGLSPWRLAATEQLVSGCRSVIVGLAISMGRLSMEQALEAARVEEEFQIEGWGLVEGGHDLDQANARVRLAAPSMFLRLLKEDD